MKQIYDRRHFLKTAIASVAAVAVGDALAAPVAAPASAPQKLSPSDPTAKALGYTEDAASVKAPTFKPGSHCANCALYESAKAKDGYAPCGAFGGKLVHEKGWCMAWAAKA